MVSRPLVSLGTRLSKVRRAMNKYLWNISRIALLLACILAVVLYLCRSPGGWIAIGGAGNNHSARVCRELPPTLTLSQNAPIRPQLTWSGRGYVIGLGFWEQLIMAARNLIHLQCWAAQHGLSVVEPLVNSSYFVFTFNETWAKGQMELGRIIDLQEWRKQKHIAPLVSREQFMKEVAVFSKNVILVRMYYSERDGPMACSCNWSRELDGIASLGHRLRVVRTVCIDGKQSSLADFDRNIFGEVPTRDSLVIFSEWRGFGSDRMSVSPPCSSASDYVCTMLLSESIRRDAEEYAQRYLGGAGQYFAIMSRLERAVPKYWTWEKSDLRIQLEKNVQNILKTWKKLKGDRRTFLAFDYGKFGSDTFKSWYNYYDSEDLLLDYHKTVYENRMSFKEWENSFSEVAHTNQSAYIAFLQMEIVTNAKCVLLAGHTSNFLMVTYHLYKEKHNKSFSCSKFITHSTDSPNSATCSGDSGHMFFNWF